MGNAAHEKFGLKRGELKTVVDGLDESVAPTVVSSGNVAVDGR
jgi:hypothetical protein